MLDDFLSNQEEFARNFAEAGETFLGNLQGFFSEYGELINSLNLRTETRLNNWEQIKEVVRDGCEICVTYFIYPTDETITEWKVCFTEPGCSELPPPSPPPVPDNDWLEDWPPVPPPPSLPERDLNQTYVIDINVTGKITQITISPRGDSTQVFDAIPLSYQFSIKGAGRIVTETSSFTEFTGSVPSLDNSRQFVAKTTVIVDYIYEAFDGGEIFQRGRRFTRIGLYRAYGWTNGYPWSQPGVELGATTARLGGTVSSATLSITPNPDERIRPPISDIPPTEEDNPMNCCDDVRLRLRRLQDDMTILMRWTGARPGQMKVPKTFLKPDGLPETFIDKIKDLFGFNEQTIRSIPEFLNWQMERLQEYMGEWPIESRSPNGGKLNIPNIAMASQALLDKAIAEGEMNQMIGAASAKSLLEVGLARENIALIVSQLEAIIDFLDMEVTERQQDINHGFTMPDADNSELPSVDVNELDTPQELSDFLVESVRPMKVIELSPNQPSFGDLCLAVDKIKALLSPITVSKDDTPAQIKAKLKPEEQENNSPDFVNWVTIETQSGESNPWGDSLNERPDINSLPPIS